MKSQKWTEEENAMLVHAYMTMHTLDAQGHKFSKAAIRRNLIAGALHNRSHASIEFKFMNVSGCMRALGRLPLKGYQPAMNYQRDLMTAVCKRLGITGESGAAA